MYIISKQFTCTKIKLNPYSKLGKVFISFSWIVEFQALGQTSVRLKISMFKEFCGFFVIIQNTKPPKNGDTSSK